MKKAINVVMMMFGVITGFVFMVGVGGIMDSWYDIYIEDIFGTVGIWAVVIGVGYMFGRIYSKAFTDTLAAFIVEKTMSVKENVKKVLVKN